jgi:putative FmdB family regulatory protein
MPIFEFRCESCQEVFEHLRLNRGKTLDLRCPACGGKNLSRVLSTCAAVVGAGGGQIQSATPLRVHNRSCGKGSSCSSITLPGHAR